MDSAGSTIDPERPDSGRWSASGGRTARAGLTGAVLGIGAAVGALVLVTSGVGAQPTVDAGSAADQLAPPAEEVVELDAEFDDADFEAHWACVDEVLAPYEAEFEVVDGEDGDAVQPDLTDADWEAIEGALTECDELLPAGVLEQFELENEAFEAYDQCLVDNGIAIEGAFEDLDDLDDAELADGAIVFLEDGDGSTIVEFGAGDGSVTVTQQGGEINVATDGDVTAESFDLAELDAAHAACEEQLPEGLFEGEWDDEYLDLDDLDDLDEEAEELEGADS
ncbi:MAG: hypothetical protein AAGA93_08430 [Actinomycetota bacterium]